MTPEEVEQQYQDKIRQRSQSLESLGYTLVRPEVPANPMDQNDTVGNVLDDLLQREFGRKEYVVLPNNSSGSSHRIYAKNLIDVTQSSKRK